MSWKVNKAYIFDQLSELWSVLFSKWCSEMQFPCYYHYWDYARITYFLPKEKRRWEL